MTVVHEQSLPDLQARFAFLSHRDPELITLEKITDWIEDTGEIAEAVNYHHLGQRALAREIIEEVAEQVHLDVSGGYFTAQESLYRHLLKRAHPGKVIFGVIEHPDGTRDVYEKHADAFSA